MDSHHIFSVDPHAPDLSRLATFQSLCLPEECLFEKKSSGTSEKFSSQSRSRIRLFDQEIAQILFVEKKTSCGLLKHLGGVNGNQKPFKKWQFHKKRSGISLPKICFMTSLGPENTNKPWVQKVTDAWLSLMGNHHPSEWKKRRIPVMLDETRGYRWIQHFILPFHLVPSLKRPFEIALRKLGGKNWAPYLIPLDPMWGIDQYPISGYKMWL